MRILYHHRTKSRDGQAVHIRELVGALRERGHQLAEWSLSPALGGAPASRMGQEGGRLGRLAEALPRFVYELAEHAYGPLVQRRLARAGQELGAQLLYERHALNNTAGLLAARRLGIPLLLEVNSPLTDERSQHEVLVFRRWARRVERRVLRAADRVLVVTDVLAERVVAMGVPAGRVAVIRNGVELSRYPDPGPGPGPEVVVGFTGFFRPWHGLDDLVDALADGSLPASTRLLLVGEGPSRTAIERRARERGVASRVSITGAVERDRIPQLVRSMDICVQPGATPWASPLKLFEYMGAGKAIVAPDQPNLREVLRNSHDALLFAPGDARGLAACVARLAGDPGLRAELGLRARATVEERRYTWAANAERVEQLAASCLQRGAPR